MTDAMPVPGIACFSNDREQGFQCAAGRLSTPFGLWNRTISRAVARINITLGGYHRATDLKGMPALHARHLVSFCFSGIWKEYPIIRTHMYPYLLFVLLYLAPATLQAQIAPALYGTWALLPEDPGQDDLNSRVTYRFDASDTVLCCFDFLALNTSLQCTCQVTATGPNNILLKQLLWRKIVDNTASEFSGQAELHSYPIRLIPITEDTIWIEEPQDEERSAIRDRYIRTSHQPIATNPATPAAHISAHHAPKFDNSNDSLCAQSA